jgi:hypothetical protein
VIGSRDGYLARSGAVPRCCSCVDGAEIGGLRCCRACTPHAIQGCGPLWLLSLGLCSRRSFVELRICEAERQCTSPAWNDPVPPERHVMKTGRGCCFMFHGSARHEPTVTSVNINWHPPLLGAAHGMCVHVCTTITILLGIGWDLAWVVVAPIVSPGSAAPAPATPPPAAPAPEWCRAYPKRDRSGAGPARTRRPLNLHRPPAAPGVARGRQPCGMVG